MSIRPNGNVGIQATSPSSTLRVNGNITASGNCCGSSDARMKHRVQPLRNALTSLLAIRGIRYHWRIDEYPEQNFQPGEHIGFIAQEIRKFVPEVVVEEDDGYLAVDYGRLTPVLVEAVKELHSKVTDREAQLLEQASQIDAQQQQISELAQRIAELEAMVHQAAAQR